MNTGLEVERVHPDRLSREVWAFRVYDVSGVMNLYLDTYRIEARPTTRHKWRCGYLHPKTGLWQTRNPNSGRHHITREIKRADVPLPRDVAREAYTTLCGRVRLWAGHPNLEGEDGGQPWNWVEV